MSSTLFISHSSADEAAAKDLERRLGEAGHRCLFLDFDPARGIVAGQSWERSLYAKLRACRALIALCSDNYLASHWCFAEAALARMEGKQIFTLRIAPLSDDGALPSILTEGQNIDLRDDVEEGYGRLWRGLREAEIEPADPDDWDPSEPPYPGLQTFRERDAGIFFGRAAETDKGLELLEGMRRQDHPRLLLVLGASGSGKSSLARAGIVPQLRRRARDWLVVDPFSPGKEPLEELAAALGGTYDRDWEHLLEKLESDGDLAKALRRLGRSRPAAVREASPLLVIDQFEELLGHTGDDHPANRFLALLSAGLLADNGPLVLATMRSDFLGVFQQHPALAGLDVKSLSLGPMSRQGMREVIEKPARLAAIALEPGLTGMLLDDTGGPDALPLLAFTLRVMWTRYRDDRLFEIAEYEDLGRLQGAVAKEADAVLEAALRLGSEAELRQAFLRMVRLTEDGTGFARQPVARDELPAAVLPMLQHFEDRRLLVSRGRGDLEVAHDALFRSWRRLRGWLEDSRAELYQLDLLRRATREWLGHDRDRELLVHRGSRLEDAEKLARTPGFVLSETEQAYLTACRAERDAAIEAARRMADTARVAIATDWRDRDPTRAALVLLELEKPAETPYAVQRLVEVLSRRLARQELGGHDDSVRYAAFSPAGDRVVTAAEDGTARVWSTAGAGPPTVLRGHDGGLRAAAFSPDGARIVTASRDGTARIWAADGSADPIVLRGHAEELVMARFHPTGDRVVTASTDGTARVWQADGKGEPIVLAGHEGQLTDARFDPNGCCVLTAGFDGSARVWASDSGEARALLPNERSVMTAVYSPDGYRVATGTAGGVVAVFPLDGAGEPQAIKASHSAISAVEFSPDGAWLLTAGWDGVGAVWKLTDLEGTEPIPLLGQDGPLMAAAFSPRGDRVLTASDSGVVRVWTLDGSGAVAELRGHQKTVYQAGFSPDGTAVVSASADETARLWQVEEPTEPRVLLGHTQNVLAAAVSPDGTRVATAGNDNTVRLWPLGSAAEPEVRRGFDGAPEALQLTDSRFALVTTEREEGKVVSVWRSLEAASPVRLVHPERVHSLALSPDGRHVVTGCRDREVRVWSVDQGTVLTALPHDSIADNIAFSPDGARLATFADRTLRLWSSDDWRELRCLPGYRGFFKTARFTAEGCRVVTGDDDGNIYVWPAQGPGAPLQLKGHSKFVTTTAFHPGGDRLVSTSWDNTIRLWTLDGSEQPLVLTGHEEQVAAIAFSRDGDLMVTAACDHTARIWHLSPESLQAIVRDRTAVALDRAFRSNYLGETAGRRSAHGPG